LERVVLSANASQEEFISICLALCAQMQPSITEEMRRAALNFQNLLMLITSDLVRALERPFILVSLLPVIGTVSVEF